jgi:hypothetical protein
LAPQFFGTILGDKARQPISVAFANRSNELHPDYFVVDGQLSALCCSANRRAALPYRSGYGRMKAVGSYSPTAAERKRTVRAVGHPA